MPTKPGPPISIRLPKETRNLLAAYAAENDVAFNKAVVTFVELGLRTAGLLPDPDALESGEDEKQSSPVAPASSQNPDARADDPGIGPVGETLERIKELAKPKTKPKPAAKPESKSSPGMCEHRVPLSSFCAKCAGMSF